VPTLIEQARSNKPAAASILPRAIWPLLVGLAIGALMFYIIGPGIGDYPSKIVLIAGINIILAVSLTVVNGFTGQFSMGHAGFMAVGGYVAATITYYGSMKLFGSADPAGGVLSFTGGADKPTALARWGDALFIGSCLMGGVGAAIAGYIVGLPSLRLRGDYLAIVTLGFGEIVRVLLQGTHEQIQPWRVEDALAKPVYELAISLGGPKGFQLLPTYTTLFWVYLFVVVTLIICYRVKNSSTGRAFLSIREDEIAAQAMGVDITKYKVRAFVLAAFFAGVAGGLYAMDIGAINAGDLGFLKSFDIIIMVVLGGMGSISGAALAAIILTILPELLRNPPPVWPVGLVLIALIAGVSSYRKRFRWKPIIVIVIASTLLEVGRQIALSKGINVADFRLILYALLLITMMLVRPQGIFGIHEIWEILPGHARREAARNGARGGSQGGKP
jgi:branched-chain amino acid transport system permease protein